MEWEVSLSDLSEEIIGHMYILHGSKPFRYKYEALNSVLDLLHIEITSEDFKTEFIKNPASCKYHGAFVGGLIRHSAGVALKLYDYTEAGLCKWELDRSPAVIGLFHDICKVGTYSVDGMGNITKKPKETDLIKGHATKSLALLSTDLFKFEQPLTEQEMLCIRYHMGAYEKDDWQGIAYSVQKYPEVLYTHTADMYASHVIGV